MPSKRKRNLIVCQTYTHGSGEDQTFGCRTQLPLGSASVVESENAAARIMQAVNAQLDYSGSKLRLIMHDIEAKKPVKITFPEG